MGLKTTKEAAEILGYASDAGIRKLIERGKIKPQKFGRDWMISEEELSTIPRVKTRAKKTS
jgi:excisionase family DNA binding protein